MSLAMLAIFWARVCDHVLVVGRIVADVAGDVFLLQAADAMLQPGVPGMAHGRTRRSSRL